MTRVVVCEPSSCVAVIQYCGFEGSVLNVLHSPKTTAYVDKWPRISPAIWFGDCWHNGTGTAHGWTQGKLKSFLSFLDRTGVTLAQGGPVISHCHRLPFLRDLHAAIISCSCCPTYRQTRPRLGVICRDLVHGERTVPRDRARQRRPKSQRQPHLRAELPVDVR